MNQPEFLKTVIALPTIIGESGSAKAAWTTVRKQAIDRWGLISDLPEFDIDAETDNLVTQLRDVFSNSPPPFSLTLLYYGLYTSFDSSNSIRDSRAGLYVAGTTTAIRAVESSSDLAGSVLDYTPDGRYLQSAALDELRAAADSNEADYNRFDYGLMLCVASILCCFASWKLGIRCRIVVGFDAGDALEFPAKTL